jgi:hypothetical protein
MLQLGLGPRTDCDDDSSMIYRHVSLCRLYLGTSDAKSLYPCLKNCAFHPKSSALAPVGPPMIQFVSLEKGKVRIRSFRKNIYSSSTKNRSRLCSMSLQGLVPNFVEAEHKIS